MRYVYTKVHLHIQSKWFSLVDSEYSRFNNSDEKNILTPETSPKHYQINILWGESVDVLASKINVSKSHYTHIQNQVVLAIR